MSLSTPTSSHIRSLDGLRGWAAIAVIFYHGLLHYDLPGIERVLYRSVFFIDGFWDFVLKTLLIVFNGESAVILFFVLSGFVLRRSLERAAGGPAGQLAIVFGIKRICRLLPAVIVAVVSFRLLASVCHQIGLTAYPLHEWAAVARNAFLYSTEVIGPSWSIQTELAATIVILVAFFARRWFGMTGLLLAFLYTCFAIDFPRLVMSTANLWPYAIGFVTGMVVAEESVVDGLRAITRPGSQIVWLVAFVGGRHLVERAGVSGLIGQTIIGGLLVGSLVAHPATRMAAWLSQPLSQFLGRISYSLYLTNVMFLELFWAVLPAPTPGDRFMMIATGFASALGAFLLAIPTSYVAFRWVETPFNTLGRSVSARLDARRDLH